MFEHIREDDNKNLVEKGFTLVELLIVVVILGILAGIVVFAVGNLTDDAKKNSCMTDQATYESAVEAYKAKTGAAPANEAALVPNYVKQVSTFWNVDPASAPDVVKAEGTLPAGCTDRATS